MASGPILAWISESRSKISEKNYITESPTLTLPPPTIPLTTVPTNGTDQTSVMEY